jgi:putative PEP-CTERM system TPR-repeat lipoprotein
MPDAPEPRLFLARYHLLMRDPQKALDTVRPALQRVPNDAGLLEVAGRAQLLLKLYDDAAGTFRTLTEVRPDSAVARYMHAEALMGTKDVAGMRGELETAVRLDSQHRAARLALARLLLLQKEVGQAEQHLSELKKLGPDDPALFEFEGDLRIAQRRPADALAAYQEAHARGPTAELTSKLAETRWLNGSQKDAVATLDEWLKRHPEGAKIRFQLATYYLRQKQTAAARTEFERIVEAQPDLWEARNELAWLLLKDGNLSEAYRHAARARELAPRNLYVMDTFAMVALARGETKRAIAILREVVSSPSPLPEFRFHLAQAIAQDGNKDEAREILRAVIEDKRPFAERQQAEELFRTIAE